MRTSADQSNWRRVERAQKPEIYRENVCWIRARLERSLVIRRRVWARSDRTEGSPPLRTHMTRFCVWIALALAGVACSTDESVTPATHPDAGQGGFGGLGAGGSAGGGTGTTGTGGADFDAGTTDGNSPDVSVISDGGISDAP